MTFHVKIKWNPAECSGIFMTNWIHLDSRRMRQQSEVLTNHLLNLIQVLKNRLYIHTYVYIKVIWMYNEINKIII